MWLTSDDTTSAKLQEPANFFALHLAQSSVFCILTVLTQWFASMYTNYATYSDATQSVSKDMTYQDSALLITAYSTSR